jgi:hypothetical protein
MTRHAKGSDDELHTDDKPNDDAGAKDGDWLRFTKRFEGYMPDMVKRATLGGIRSFLQTEEGLRTVLGAIVPKEVFQSVTEQLDKSKSDAVRLISAEFRQFLEKIDIPRELQRLLTSLSIEVKTEIRFVPNDKAVVKPEVKTRAKVKTAGSEGPPEG